MFSHLHLKLTILMFKTFYTKIRSIYHWFRYQYHSRLEWKTRIKDVVNCPDNKYIVRAKNAGEVIGDFQIMHNGIKVKKNGYYGSPITTMLKKSKGVHEPQEERVFADILSQLRQHATMMELGSYWAFYSMWFLAEIKEGQSYLFEADTDSLMAGKSNFESNGLSGTFINCFINDKLDLCASPPVFTIDYIMAQNNIEFADIIHSDIEGYELNMLHGAVKTIKENRVGYFVISTHSDEIHYTCLEFLKAHNFIIICEADKSNTYSYDGLIVARSANYPGIGPVDISQKTGKV